MTYTIRWSRIKICTKTTVLPVKRPHLTPFLDTLPNDPSLTPVSTARSSHAVDAAVLVVGAAVAVLAVLAGVVVAALVLKLAYGRRFWSLFSKIGHNHIANQRLTLSQALINTLKITSKYCGT